MPSTPPQIRVGIGGWTFEPWRGTFYPDGLAQKRELEYASSHLTSIEINGTYYGSQKPESFARWREETPDHFMFSVKGPRFATNRRVLAEGGQSIERFLDKRRSGAEGKARPDQLAVPSHQVNSTPPISKNSSSCCRTRGTDARSGTWWRCATRVSGCPNSLRC